MNLKVLAPFLLCFCSITLFAQNKPWYLFAGKSLAELRADGLVTPSPGFRPALFFFQAEKKEPGATLPHPLKTPEFWKFNELAFFCRIEVKLERMAKIPIKFRLGKVQEVEKLEGKY